MNLQPASPRADRAFALYRAGGAQDWVFYGDTDGNPATVEFELHVHSLLGAVWFDDITL